MSFNILTDLTMLAKCQLSFPFLQGSSLLQRPGESRKCPQSIYIPQGTLGRLRRQRDQPAGVTGTLKTGNQDIASTMAVMLVS